MDAPGTDQLDTTCTGTAVSMPPQTPDFNHPNGRPFGRQVQHGRSHGVWRPGGSGVKVPPGKSEPGGEPSSGAKKCTPQF